MCFGRIEWTRASGLPRHPPYCRRAIASSPTPTVRYVGSGVKEYLPQGYGHLPQRKKRTCVRFGRIEWARASGLPRHPAYCRRAIASSPTPTVRYAGSGVKEYLRKAMGIYRKEKSALACALVGLSGLEPPTPTLSGWCSNLLSYNPIWVVEIHGFEPRTS